MLFGGDVNVDELDQIQASGMNFEFGKVSNKRDRDEIETHRMQEDQKVHEKHKR